MMEVPTLDALPTHVFLSYSRDDEPYAESLENLLKSQGYPVWRDRSSLKVGSPDWQEAIRVGIEESFAVVLMGSPAFRQSVYCRAEISIAQSFNKFILPLWIRGERWTDCAPFEFLNSQYVECRFHQKEVFEQPGDRAISPIEKMKQKMVKKKAPLSSNNANLEMPGLDRKPSISLVMDSITKGHVLAALNDNHQRELPAVFKTTSKSITSIYRFRRRPTNYLVIGLREGSFPDAKDLKLVVADHVAESLTIQQLLDAVYVNLLADALRPFSYGRDWLLLRCQGGHSDANRVLAPFDWLMSGTINALERYRVNAQNMTLDEAGIPLNSELEVGKPIDIDLIGVLAHDLPLVAAFENYKSFMGCARHFVQADVGMSFDTFSYRAVFERAGYHPRSGQIYVQREGVPAADLTDLQRYTPPYCMKYLY